MQIRIVGEGEIRELVGRQMRELRNRQLRVLGDRQMGEVGNRFKDRKLRGFEVGWRLGMGVEGSGMWDSP